MVMAMVSFLFQQTEIQKGRRLAEKKEVRLGEERTEVS
jgi:hypothetical protein